MHVQRIHKFHNIHREGFGNWAADNMYLVLFLTILAIIEMGVIVVVGYFYR